MRLTDTRVMFNGRQIIHTLHIARIAYCWYLHTVPWLHCGSMSISWNRIHVAGSEPDPLLPDRHRSVRSERHAALYV